MDSEDECNSNTQLYISSLFLAYLHYLYKECRRAFLCFEKSLR